jgi:hypothetical protein
MRASHLVWRLALIPGLGVAGGALGQHNYLALQTNAAERIFEVSKMLVRCSSGVKRRVVACRIKTKSAFPALYAPISPAWERGCLRINRCALQKRVEGGSLSLNMAFIRWMAVET